MFIAHGTPELLFASRPVADVVVLTQPCEDMYTIKMHAGHLTEKCLTFLKIGNKQVIFFNADQMMHMEEHGRRHIEGT